MRITSSTFLGAAAAAAVTLPMIVVADNTVTAGDYEVQFLGASGKMKLTNTESEEWIMVSQNKILEVGW